jgi:ubiquinone/menaquinone biosynthesis C-methylase UbiE
LDNKVAFHAAVAKRERADMKFTPQELVDRYRTCDRWRTRYPECVIRFLTLHRPRHICDFGCGSGEMACRVGRLGYRITGLDVSSDLISVARERAVLEGVSENVKFMVAYGANVNISDGTFAAMLAMSVVHHMPVGDAIDAIDRVLCPGGRVAFLEPVAYHKMLQWIRGHSLRMKDTSHDERQLSADEV